MCGTCGCGEAEPSGAPEPEAPGRTVRLEEAILGRNDALAAENRRRLAEAGVASVDLLGSPGAGKTTLLCRLIPELAAAGPILVVEGDQATDGDARRVRKAGARAIQVNTGSGCHLDAAMVAGALDRLDPPPGSLVVIENVGNLICPAMFDLGAAARVVVASTPEGEEKPLKYPHAFRSADLVLLAKVDLLPHLRFDVARFEENVRAVGSAEVIRVSALDGTGVTEVARWLLTVGGERVDARA